MIEDSAQTTPRDTRVGGMETESSSKRCGMIADIPEQEGKIRFLPRKVRPPEKQGETDHAGHREVKNKNCAVNDL